jgi:RNA polymerase sigma-70 factor (ECF subfamily)
LRKDRARLRLVRDDGGAHDSQSSPAPEARDPGVLSGVLTLLPEHQREVLLMRFVDDMSMDQIATALSIPTGTVKSRLHLAIKILRENPATAGYFQIEETDESRRIP